MPSSRSAKEICREDPGSISCKVATNREARAKRFEEKYAEEKPVEAEPEKPEEEVKSPPPKPVTERQKYLDDLERKAGIKE